MVFSHVNEHLFFVLTLSITKQWCLFLEVYCCYRYCAMILTGVPQNLMLLCLVDISVRQLPVGVAMAKTYPCG